jgi:hypothetical protein
MNGRHEMKCSEMRWNEMNDRDAKMSEWMNARMHECMHALMYEMKSNEMK